MNRDWSTPITNRIEYWNILGPVSEVQKLSSWLVRWLKAIYSSRIFWQLTWKLSNFIPLLKKKSNSYSTYFYCDSTIYLCSFSYNIKKVPSYAELDPFYSIELIFVNISSMDKRNLRSTELYEGFLSWGITDNNCRRLHFFYIRTAF